MGLITESSILDKSVRNIHCVSHPVLDQDGNLDEFIGTVIDVTERKRADENARPLSKSERGSMNLKPIWHISTA